MTPPEMLAAVLQNAQDLQPALSVCETHTYALQWNVVPEDIEWAKQAATLLQSARMQIVQATQMVLLLHLRPVVEPAPLPEKE